MRLSFLLIAALAFQPTPTPADEHTSITDHLPPGVIALAYQELQKEQRRRYQTSPISVTSFDALRDYVPQDQIGQHFELTLMGGWDGIHPDFERGAKQDKAFIGSRPEDILALTLFDEIDGEIQLWTLNSAERASEIFALAAAKPGVNQLSETALSIQIPGSGGNKVYLQQNGNMLAAGRRLEDLQTAAPASLQGNPDYQLFEQAYRATLNSALSSVPEGATAIEVTFLNWGNVMEPDTAKPFPRNISESAVFTGTDLAPFYGITLVDWRTTGPAFGVSLAFNHFDQCEGAAPFPDVVASRWSSLKFGPDGDLAAQWLGSPQSVELVKAKPGETEFCATVLTGPAVSIRDPGNYALANPMYSNGYHLFRGVMPNEAFFQP